MVELDGRDKIFLSALSLLVIVVSVGFIQSETDTQSVEADNWREVTLENVNSGENFSISELEKPVFIETFAVWCPTCTNQQLEMKKLHESKNVTSVSLNVDPNEDAEQIRSHTEENGFDWRYAISPPELTRQLISKFGNTVANPPSAPVILVCENNSRRLSGNGVKPASELQAELEKGC